MTRKQAEAEAQSWANTTLRPWYVARLSMDRVPHSGGRSVPPLQWHYLALGDDKVTKLPNYYRGWSIVSVHRPI